MRLEVHQLVGLDGDQTSLVAFRRARSTRNPLLVAARVTLSTFDIVDSIQR